MSIGAIFASLDRDFLYALRSMSRRRGFTVVAVLTLALGIGATTATFSVIYSVLMKPLPYPSSDELVRIRHPRLSGIGFDDASSNMYLTYRQENQTFASIGLWQESSATVMAGDESERVRALRVTDGTLQALGVQPMLGRWFGEDEYGPAADGPAPVILSHAYWQRRFGGERAVLGRELSIDSPSGNGTLRLTQPSLVVGILPQSFKFLDATPQPDIIIPVRLDPARQAHGIYAWQMLARLKPGVTVAEARADLERMSPIWFDAWPPFPGTTKEQLASLRIVPTVQPLLSDLVSGVANMLWVLMGAIGGVLMIACANIGNLMLVRADSRLPEFGVRTALGAVPARVARELLVESFCLGLLGSLGGLLLAYVGLRALVAIGPVDLPRLQEIAIYPPVLAFTVAVSIASTLLFGSITALKYAMRVDAPMTGPARGSSASRERNRTRNALVVVQVALAVVLVVSAALMFRTFQALRDVDPGFSDAATIQTAKIWIPTNVFPEPTQYTRIQREIVDRIAALPGVSSAAFADAVPIESPGMQIAIAVDGQPWPEGRAPQMRVKFVSPGYFQTMGTRLIAGRDVTWSDIDVGGRVAIISEAFARELGVEPRDAIGKGVRFEAFSQNPWREVIGVVQNVHEESVYETPPPMVYWPVLTENMFGNPVVGTPWATLVVRSERAGTVSLTEEIREVVRSVSASIPISQETTMDSLYASSLARTSFTLVMLGIAGSMALALGVIGIYGVIAYVVSQRAREVGIRSALGASPVRIERMFMRQGFVLAGVGVIAGLIGAVALGRVMSSLLFGVGPLDVAAYAAALAVTFAAAALASYVPARRAARISPMETLKTE